MTHRGFRRLSFGVLIYNLAVIVWGAYVRASGSGAGCGQHWPDCNGQLIPMNAGVKTLVEFTHRATSGLALLSVVALAFWAFRLHAPGSPVRKGALASLLLMLSEAAVGAGLVLFELVAGNKSIARAEFMSVHLMNTFLLLGALLLTTFWASGGRALQWRGQGYVSRILMVALAGMMLLGVSGAITALGDTLFPAASLAEGMRQDFSPTAHVFLRLRRWHPFIAMLMDFYVTAIALLIADARPRRAVRLAAWILIALFFGQLCLGTMNLLLNAPVGIQLAHLLTADLVWLTLVFLTAAALEDSAPSATAITAAGSDAKAAGP